MAASPIGCCRSHPALSLSFPIRIGERLDHLAETGVELLPRGDGDLDPLRGLLLRRVRYEERIARCAKVMKETEFCVFCGTKPTNIEHVWPKWIGRYLGRTRTRFLTRTSTGTDRRFDGFSYTDRAKVVCEKTCNGGWMKALEEPYRSRSEGVGWVAGFVGGKARGAPRSERSAATSSDFRRPQDA